MIAKKLVAVGLAVFVTLGLTACDPPMPPEVIAAQAEKTVNCVSVARALFFFLCYQRLNRQSPAEKAIVFLKNGDKIR